jgi:hypothetical protein
VVTTGSGTTSGTGVGSRATSEAALEGAPVPEPPHVQGAYHDAFRIAEEGGKTLGVEDAPMRQLEDRRGLVREDDAESAVLLGAEENCK